MKTKKCGVYAALAAVLLITAMLVTCADPLTLGDSTVPQKGEKRVFTPPPGKAYIRVVIPTKGARTILPDEPEIDYYKIEVLSKTAGGDNYNEGDVVGDGDFATANTEVIVVTPDSYEVTVTGFTDEDVAVVSGQSDIVVGAGGATATIALKEIIKTGVNGTFNYFISTPLGSTAVVTATPYSGGGSSTTLTGGTATLQSGIYWLRVALTQDKHAPMTYAHILHVYGGQVSSWGESGSPIALTLNKNAYDITLNLEYGTASPVTYDNGGLGWSNGVVPPAPTVVTDYPARPNSGGFKYTVESWHTLNTLLTENVYNFTAKIYKDFPLYAKWEATALGSDENLSITITPYTHATEQLEGILTYDTASVNLPHADPFDSTISIEAEWSGVLDSIVGWHYGSTLVTASETLTDTLITSVANINLANPGSWPFTFVGIKDGKQYSGIFTVTIQAP